MAVRRTRIVEIYDTADGGPAAGAHELLEYFGIEAAWEKRPGAEPGVFDIELLDDEAASIGEHEALLDDKELAAEIVDHLPKPWEA